MLKEFWMEEDGMGTVEIILIIAALVCVALIFRQAIVDFVTDTVKSVFGDAEAGAGTGAGDSGQ